ncbi:MAG: hypothetical protein ACFFG0_12475 [Candidatus Thorarchaeota archaeon]
MEIVVIIGLPGEERIFCHYGDVQFYIRERKEKVHITGNYDATQKKLQ